MLQSPLNKGPGPLTGVRVLDFTRALAGPFCTRLLCDLGAEVIKIEPPPGDQSRNFMYVTEEGISGYFMQHNVGKKGLCIDLRLPSGIALAKALADLSDVVVENYRPGVMGRLGLDYHTLTKTNPGLVMCSISGYGQEGSYVHRPAADHTAQAMSGVAYLNGDPDGRPRLVGTAVGDTVGGAHAFGAICAALYRRAVTQKGEYIDLSLVDSLIWQNEWAFEYRLLSGGKDLPKKSRPVVNVHGIYKARDGYITLAAVTQQGWENLTRVMEKPELASDPRFLTPRDRELRWKDIDRIIEDWVLTFPSARAAVHAFTDVGGLVGSEVLSVPDVLEDPRMEERGLLAEVTDPVLGPVKVLNSPFKFAGSQSGPRAHAPLRGEHTVPVLRDLLGLSRERVLELMGEGAVIIEERAVEGALRDLGV